MTRIEKINRDAGLSGNIAISSFNKFRGAVTLLFILFTAVAIALIFSEYVVKFEVKEIEGWNIYYTTLITFFVVGFGLSWYAGHTKINNLRAATFARTWKFRASSFFAFIFVTIGIVTINSYGVDAGASLSKRYLENELINSEEYKSKQKISNVFEAVANHSLGNDYDNLIVIQEQEKERLNKQRREAIREFRKSNLIQVQKANNIHAVNRQYDKKLERVDKKIQELTKLKLIQSTKNEQITINKAKEFERAEENKLAYKASVDEANQEDIDFYSNVGLWVAIAGEIIDAMIALTYFLMIKTNDNNTDEVLTIQKGVNSPVMDTIKTSSKSPIKETKVKSEVIEQGKPQPLRKVA